MITELFAPYTFLQIVVSLFLAILFLQSGFDKVFDWKGNLSWLKSHFAKSLLKDVVPFLLATITLFEVASGITSAIGAVSIVWNKQTNIALIGAQLSATSILMLFFGQRMAKDYAGAATLVPYFILTLIAIWLLGK
ncbi:MAG: DoxX family protein [Flammeovirgaceae bacterium]|nr:DoxX family protein [Flammeovirgaceae bacterium]MDW8286594.1 DoxX family protein [Flammeovirgaceae bacterium]